ncbi:MAG: EAL domain-containing protein [Proteobacteria bacterium]|nr:EAL domain-containing protein [Pseudomonadota bacterium]
MTVPTQPVGGLARLRTLPVLGLGLSLLLPVLFAVLLWYDLQHDNRLAAERAVLVGQAVERQLGERLDGLAHAMRDIAEDAQEQATTGNGSLAVPHGSPLQDVVLLPRGAGAAGVDLRGNPASAPWLPPPFADARPAGLAIGAPVRAGLHQRWMVPVAWDGDPQRRVGALVDADWFAEPLVDYPLGADAIVSIVHTDGVLLARSNDNQTHVGTRMGHGHPLRTVYQYPQWGHFGSTGKIDGVLREMVFQQMPHTPLIVIVGTTSDAVFAAWWPYAAVSFGAALLLAGWWLRLTRAFARSHAEQGRLLADLRVQSGRAEEARRIAHLGDWSWNIDSGGVDWSPEVFAIWGVPAQQGPMHIQHIPGLIHPDDRAAMEASMLATAQGNEPGEMQFRIIRADDGSVRTIYARGEWADRTPGRRVIHGIQQDITELAQARERLNLAERQYRYLFEHNPLPMWVYDRDSLRFLAANDAMLAAYGYTRDELLAGSVLDIRPPEEREALRATANDTSAARPQGSVWTHLRRDGSQVRVQVHAQRIDFEGRPAWLVLGLDVTEREASEQRFQLIARATSDAIWDWDAGTGVTWRSQSYCTLFGYAPGEIAPDQQAWAQLVHPDDIDRVNASTLRSLDAGTNLWEERYRFRRKDGSYALVLDRCLLLRDDRDRVLRAIGGMLDITQRSRDEEDLRLLRRAVEATDDGVVIADARQPELPVVYANPAFESMTGFGLGDGAGAPLHLLDAIGETTRHEAVELLRAIDEQREARVLLRGRRQDGQPYWNEFHLAPVRDGAGALTHFVGVQADVTERQRAQEQLAFSATHDELTGLPNRQLLVDRLQQALLNGERQGRSVVVLFVDVDDFKLINDSLGHSAGDAALRTLARRLRQAVAEPDTVARFGGDEFVVVLSEHTDEAAVQQAIDTLSAALAQPLEISGTAHYLGASIGWCRSPDAGRDAEALLMRADLAMYKAKQSGRNRVVAYEPSFDDQVGARLRLVNELRLALERGEFELAFQPVFAMDGRPLGMEALARWRHPTRGLLQPSHFIGACEDSGLIVPLGRWVLREAARHHRLLAAAGLAGLRIAVNVSSLHFQQDLQADVEAALREHAVPHGALELELTESVIMGNTESAIEVMRRLDGLGVALAVDDFGTGYSSLSYLKRLPIDRLKIDRSFVRDLAVDPDDAAICTSIIGLAHALGLRTVAEGVETTAQLQWLRERGCDEVQGFLLGHPLPFAATLAALRKTITAPA